MSRSLFFVWPPNRVEKDEAFGRNMGFIMLSVFGLLFMLYGLGNYLYTELCWNFGMENTALVVNKNEFHGKNTSYRLLLEYPSRAQFPIRGEVDVTSEYYSTIRINTVIAIKYFPVLPNKIIADPNEKWFELFVGVFGLAALFLAKNARDKYFALTKLEPIPLRNILDTVSSWKKRASARRNSNGIV